MPHGPGRQRTVYVHPEHERTWLDAQRYARKTDVPLAALITAALEEYMTVHQRVNGHAGGGTHCDCVR